jgi:hypothetical protein
MFIDHERFIMPVSFLNALVICYKRENKLIQTPAPLTP